ncbi:MAG: hypothetical protein JJ913_08115 [Rhizobiaceae bacterium]|nr:hypothetical protein [Rhizobiaceae bacterium]
MNPVEQDIKKELFLATLQRQFDYGKWVLASLLAAHLGGLLVISQAGERSGALFAASGQILVYGLGLALVAGGLAWINFSVASVAYWNMLRASFDGEPDYEVPNLVAWTVKLTLFGSPIVAITSLAAFFWAAHRALAVT